MGSVFFERQNHLHLTKDIIFWHGLVQVSSSPTQFLNGAGYSGAVIIDYRIFIFGSFMFIYICFIFGDKDATMLMKIIFLNDQP